MTSNGKGSDTQTDPGNDVKDMREEKKIYIAERNQLTKITQEINKLKKEIEQIDNKEFSLPQYNINFNSEKSILNNDTLNGINYEFNNRTVGQYDDENNTLINNNGNYNSNENNYTNSQNEEELIDKKNKIENLINNPNNIIMERIDFYKNRCINIIGKKVYTKAYDKIKKDKQNIKKNNENSDYNLREELTAILGKNNIGFWQMINQILVLEDLLNKNKS